MKQFNIDAASQDDTLTRTNNAAATTTTTNNIIISSSVPSSRRLPTNRSFNEPPAPILIQGSPKHSFYYDFPPPPLQTTTSSSFSLNFLQHQDELQQHNQQQQKQPLTPVSPTSPNTAAMLPLLPRPALMENPNVQYQQQLPLSSSPGSHSIASSTASGETLHNYNNTLMMMSASPPQNLVLFGDYSSQLHALHHHGQQQLYKYDDVKDTKATAAIATINSDDIILNLDHNILRDIDSSASNSSNPETDQSNTPFSSSLPSSSKLETLISWIGFPLVGFGFGFLLQKGRVYEPHVIQNQMWMRDFTMMQLFLCAAGTSMLVLNTLVPSIIRTPTRTTYDRRHADRGLVSLFIGSFIIGLGMVISGACPGTIHVQIGSSDQVVYAWLTLIGGIVGIALYAVSENWFLKKHFIYNKMPHSIGYADELLRFFPIQITATMTALMFYGCALIFHFFLPNSSLGDPSGGSSSSSSSSSYLPHLTGDLLPIIAGIAIGLLQIPAVLMTGETLGMSGSLVSIITPLAWIPYKLGLVSDAVVLGRFHPAVIEAKRMRVLIMMEVDNTRDPRSGLNKKRQSIFSSSAESNSTRGAADRAFWFKVLLRAMQKSIYLGSIMLGAYFGSLLYIRNPILRIGTSPVSVSSILVLTPFSLGHLPLEVQSFIGGVLLFFGAKMAGGCTSSHGISGMGTLGLKSFFAVGGIFAGGCCLIFILGNGFNLVH